MRRRNEQDAPVSAIDQALLRYVDDRLDVEDRERADALLAEAPETAQRVAAWQAHDQLLHRHFDPLVHNAVPSHLLRAARRASHRTPMRHAAAIGWLIIGAVIGWIAHPQTPAPDSRPAAAATLPQIAALAHATYTPEKRHAVEVPASEEAHLVTWLSRRLDRPLKVPQLSGMGYALVGGRMLPSESGPVAQFMFQQDDGKRLTLHLRTQSGDVESSSFQFAQSGNVRVFYWLDKQVGYALSGDIERERLLAIAREVWRQLNPDTPPPP